MVMFETCGFKPSVGMYSGTGAERYIQNTDIFNVRSFLFLFEV